MKLLKRFPVDEAVRKVYDVSGPYIPKDSLELLLSHKVGAVVVRNFYGTEASRQQLVQEIESLSAQNKTSNWQVSQADGTLVNSDVDTIGVPFNVAKGRGQTQEYFNQATHVNRMFRKFDRMSPIDQIRLELDEIFPRGCVLGRDPDSHRPKLAGLVRIMKRSSQRGLVHMDEVSVCSPNHGVFSANVYLQQSLVGGEVEIWPVSFYKEEELMDYALEIGMLTSNASSVEGQRALREFVLPHPPLLVKPLAGDLLLLCVQRPHCVKGPLHGPKPRYSFQCFISHEGDQTPLQVDV